MHWTANLLLRRRQHSANLHYCKGSQRVIHSISTAREQSEMDPLRLPSNTQSRNRQCAIPRVMLTKLEFNVHSFGHSEARGMAECTAFFQLSLLEKSLSVGNGCESLSRTHPQSPCWITTWLPLLPEKCVFYKGLNYVKSLFVSKLPFQFFARKPK